MQGLPPAVSAFSALVGDVSWVSDLLVAGSLATGDYVPGVSDLDLVAVVTRSLGTAEQALLASIHEQLDAGPARGADLGCVYVEEDAMLDAQARHFTWTHGRQVHRILSEVTRAELVRAGFAVFGRPAHSMFPPVTDDDVRDAARSEVCGYWAWASRRPLDLAEPGDGRPRPHLDGPRSVGDANRAAHEQV